MTMTISGAKGGGGSTFVTKPDTLRSDDSFEILLGLGSGRWHGLADGLQSLKINGVPLENADGSSNFEDVFVIFADGNPLEDQIVNFVLGGGGNSQTVGTQLANSNPSGPGGWVTGAVSTPNADYIDLRFVAQQLFYQDTKSVRENTATIDIEMRPSGDAEWINIFSAPLSDSVTYNNDGYTYNNGDFGDLKLYLSQVMFNPGGIGFKASGSGLTIRGKTSSPFVKELRVSVPNTGIYENRTWEVRARLVEKDTVDNGDIQERRNIQFETITAVISEPLGDDPEWDGLVWAQIHGKASDQFNGFPEVTSLCKTKICKVPVPAVFDPDTRAYTEVTWDGSYVEKFTTDPAWQIKEFVEDPIHGLAGIYPGSTVDKWDALEASKYYSELVPDGKGGTHPRFNMNLTINEAKDIDEMMQYLAGAVNSYTEDVGNSTWRLKVDKPETAVMLFTEDNVFSEFQYAHTDIDTRFNDWRGTFLDENLDYAVNTVRVFDQPDIDANGIKFTEVALVGCTNAQEALRRLMFRLRVSLNEFRSVSFSTNRLGRLISPLDTILVADGALNPDHLVKSTSRLASHSGTTVELMRELRLEDDIGYRIQFSTLDGGVVEKLVTNTNPQRGDVTTIHIDSALPANVMVESAVALAAEGLAALPVAYRVLSIERAENEEDSYLINALQIDSGKWAAMDNVSATEILAQESKISIDAPTVPAGGMFQLIDYVTDAQYKRVLQVNWDRPGGSFLQGYRVEHRLNDGQWVLDHENLKDSLFEFQNLEDGTYDFKITAIDRRGVQSEPLLGRTVVDADATITPPAHIRGEFLDRPAEAPYDGFRYTTTDGGVPMTYAWDASTGQWVPEANLITEGSQIGVENGATVGATPAELLAIDGEITTIQGEIDDLFTTYGSTASAAASAAAADLDRIAAENAEVNASGYATAANASAADASDDAASAAANALLTASYYDAAGKTAAALGPSRVNAQNEKAFSSVISGDQLLDLDASGVLDSHGSNVFVDDLDEGNCVEIAVGLTTSDPYNDVAQRKVHAIDETKTYRIRARYKNTDFGSGTTQLTIYYVFLNEDYTYLGNVSASSTDNQTGWNELEFTKTGADLALSGAVYFRAVLRINNTTNTAIAKTRVSVLELQDITQQTEAKAQADIATDKAVIATDKAAEASTSESLTADYTSRYRDAVAGEFPKAMNPDLFSANDTTNGAPSTISTVRSTHPAEVSANNAYLIAVAGRVAYAHAGSLDLLDGHIYRISADVECMDDGGLSSGFSLYGRYLDGNFSNYANAGINPLSQTATVTGERKIASITLGVNRTEADYNYTGALVKFRPMVLTNRSATSATVNYSSNMRVHGLWVEDITESVDAAAQATIATTQAVIATDKAAAASASETLSAAHSSTAAAKAAAKGLTDNANFDSGKTTWKNGFPVNDTMPETSLNIVASSQGRANVLVNDTGVSRVISGSKAPIDPSRKYRIRAGIYSNGTFGSLYLGFHCYDSADAALTPNSGIGYVISNSYQAAGWIDYVSGVITGITDASSSGAGFRTNTAHVRPLALLNWNSAASQIFGLDYFYLEDVTESENALAQAAIATSQAVIATAAQAAASSSASLSASLATGFINENASFSDYPTTPGRPTGYIHWAGVTPTRVTGAGANPYALRMTGGAGISGGIYLNNQTKYMNSITPLTWYVLEAKVTLVAGTFRGAGCYFAPRNAAAGVTTTAFRMSFTGDDAAGNQVGDGVVGQTYTYSCLVQVPAASVDILLYMMNHWPNLGTTQINNGTANSGDVSVENIIDWHYAGIRPASAAEVDAQVAIPALEASVTTNSGAIADIEGAAAYTETIVAASGSNPAKVQLLAGKDGSKIGIVADSISLGNDVDGIVQDALTISGGNALFSGELDVGGTTGARVNITKNLIRIYDSAGTMRVRMGVW